MNFRVLFVMIVVGFVLFCGGLVLESGMFEFDTTGQDSGCILLAKTQSDVEDNAEEVQPTDAAQQLRAASVSFMAESASPEKVTLPEKITLGSLEPASGYKFQLELSSKGAAIRQAVLSEYKDRHSKHLKPLVLLSPVEYPDGPDILSLENGAFVFVDHQLLLSLNQLDWRNVETEQNDNSQTATFRCLIKSDHGEPVIRLVKSYKVTEDSYHLQCNLKVENLSPAAQKVRFDIAGPVGIGREGFRADMRKATGAFQGPQGKIESVRLSLKDLSKAENAEQRQLQHAGMFLWGAIANKYFAAIMVPEPQAGEQFAGWVTGKEGQYYDPNGIDNDGDETIGVTLQVGDQKLTAAGGDEDTKSFNFLLYLGPKDKPLFDRTPLYKEKGFVQAIDFRSCCCCPASILSPLAFGILAVMRWMYDFIGNYGVVIIILVFVIRLVIHPLTKKSQVSMSKFGTLQPKVEEIKRKYANNKTEMNKHMMALYKEQGLSPILGFLPMLVQMPVWIALYSAIYSSVELRGAGFLPFWITDLSAPDSLIRFTAFTIPYIKWEIGAFNLLPILMGVAFYLQQKMMPTQAAAQMNPQVAQQQKMMKIMFPLLFPLMLYNAPSGLNLYIGSSVFAGAIEQYVIKKHIREKQEAESKKFVPATSKTGGKVKKKKPKPFYKNT